MSRIDQVLVVFFSTFVSSSPLVAQAIFLEEDFESYLDDFEVEDIGEWRLVEENEPLETGSKWTITNIGARPNPPDASGIPGEFSQFMISDSDASGSADEQGSGMSHDLWSPPFDTIGSDVVWLHFDCTAILNNNGLGVFDIDASSDDGETWTNLFRRVAPARTAFAPTVSTENCNGFHGRLHVDLSSVAANTENARFRIRQFEPDDEWWIAVDNVLVDDVPPPLGGEVPLLSASFTGGIPSTWTIVSEPGNEGDNSWTSNDACTRNLIAFNGGTFPDGDDGRRMHRIHGDFALIDPACSTAIVNDRLISPAVDATNATAVYVSWKEEIRGTDSPTTYEVAVSYDGGATFEEPIFSFDTSVYGGAGDEDPFYAERAFRLEGAEGQSTVSIGFLYAPSATPGWVAIDDVVISADGEIDARTCASQAFEVEAYDATSNSISMTWRGLPGDAAYRVLADGVDLSGELAAEVRSFTHAAPPPGSTITYSLETIVGGAVDFTCEAPPVSAFVCPAEIRGCVQGGALRLEWEPGANLAGEAVRVRRGGEVVATLPLEASSFEDSPRGGQYVYQVDVSGGSSCTSALEYFAAVPGDGVLFAENFDCFESDEDVTAAGWRVLEVNEPNETGSRWTVTNPGGRANPPVLDGTPSQGAFMISDSDWSGGTDSTGSGMSHDLWTPSIDATGVDSVWLQLDCSAQLNNNGFVVFDIDVSSDAGETWENAFRRVAPARGGAVPEPSNENTDGYFGRLHVDLSDFAPGGPFLVRIRQFEPDDDWWIAIDNVVVSTRGPPGGEEDVLPNETFEDGVPDEWLSIHADGDDGRWAAEDLCFRQIPEGISEQGINRIGQSFALVDAECDGLNPFDEFLITPAIDCSDVVGVTLHFDSEVLASEAAVERVLLSVDGGETFLDRPLFSYAGGGLFDSREEPFFATRALPVPAADGQDGVAFAFHYRSAPAAGWWAITNVRVSGTTEETELRFRRGDPNDSGSANIADAIGSLNHLFGDAPLQVCPEAMDVNGDSAFNVADPIYLLNFLFGDGDPPVTPGHLECGPDEDPESSLGCDRYVSC